LKASGKKTERHLQRRRFNGWLIGFTGLLGYSLLCGNGAKRVWAAVRHRRLAPDTDLGNLIYEDPADLDIQDLPVSKLNNFGVSGTDDHLADLTKWHLQVDGLVHRPHKHSYAELKALPRLERKVLLICPGTFAYVGNWQGFSLWDLLRQCGIDDKATHVDVMGPPGKYRKVERFPLEEVRENLVFLALGVNGQPLPRKHGFPLRLVAGSHVGAEWVKFVYGVHVVFSRETVQEKGPAAGSAFFP